MDKIPPHLWVDVAQLSPKLSVAWLEANSDTQSVMRLLHHDSRDELVLRLGQQRIASLFPPWPKRGSTTNAWLQLHYHVLLARAFIDQSNLAACRWLLSPGTQIVDLLFWAAKRGQLSILQWLAATHSGHEMVTSKLKASEHYTLQRIVEKGHVHIFDWLLQTDRFCWDASFQDFQMYHHLLRLAARKGQFDMCLHLCQSYQHGDGSGWWTVIMEGARKGHLHVCQSGAKFTSLDRWRSYATGLVTAACGHPAREHRKGTCPNWRVCRWVYETFKAIIFEYWTTQHFVSLVLPSIMKSGSMEGVQWMEATFGGHAGWAAYWKETTDSLFFFAVCGNNVDMCHWTLNCIKKHCLDLCNVVTRSSFLRAARVGHLAMLQYLVNDFPDTCAGLFPDLVDQIVKRVAAQSSELAQFEMFTWVMTNKSLFIHENSRTNMQYFLTRAIENGHVLICRNIMSRLPPEERHLRHIFFECLVQLLVGAINSGNLAMCHFLAKYHGHPSEQLDRHMAAQIKAWLSALRHKKRSLAGQVATHQWALDTFDVKACQPRSSRACK